MPVRADFRPRITVAVVLCVEASENDLINWLDCQISPPSHLRKILTILANNPYSTPIRAMSRFIPTRSLVESASRREHVIPGNIYGGVPRLPVLPPFVPLPDTSTDREGQSFAQTTAMEWDTTIVNHGISWPQVENDRRHSGWAEVEKSWTKQQEQQQPQQQASTTQPKRR